MLYAVSAASWLAASRGSCRSQLVDPAQAPTVTNATAAHASVQPLLSAGRCSWAQLSVPASAAVWSSSIAHALHCSVPVAKQDRHMSRSAALAASRRMPSVMCRAFCSTACEPGPEVALSSHTCNLASLRSQDINSVSGEVPSLSHQQTRQHSQQQQQQLRRVVIVGIDPDNEGAVAVTSWDCHDTDSTMSIERLQVQVYDMPVAAVPLKQIHQVSGKQRIRRWLDVSRAQRLIEHIIADHANPCVPPPAPAPPVPCTNTITTAAEPTAAQSLHHPASLSPTPTAADTATCSATPTATATGRKTNSKKARRSTPQLDPCLAISIDSSAEAEAALAVCACGNLHDAATPGVSACTCDATATLNGAPCTGPCSHTGPSSYNSRQSSPAHAEQHATIQPKGPAQQEQQQIQYTMPDVIELRAFVESTPTIPLHSRLSTMATQVFSVGAWHGLLQMAGFQVCTVPARVWKRDLSLIGLSKGASIVLAQQLWPHHSNLLTRKRDHGRAEAMLLLSWAMGISRSAPPTSTGSATERRKKRSPAAGTAPVGSVPGEAVEADPVPAGTLTAVCGTAQADVAERTSAEEPGAAVECSSEEEAAVMLAEILARSTWPRAQGPLRPANPTDGYGNPLPPGAGLDEQVLPVQPNKHRGTALERASSLLRLQPYARRTRRKPSVAADNVAKVPSGADEEASGVAATVKQRRKSPAVSAPVAVAESALQLQQDTSQSEASPAISPSGLRSSILPVNVGLGQSSRGQPKVKENWEGQAQLAAAMFRTVHGSASLDFESVAETELRGQHHLTDVLAPLVQVVRTSKRASRK